MAREPLQHRALLGLIALILLTGGARLAQAQETPDTTDTQPTELDALIDQLGDDRFTLREQATRSIIARGPTTLPQLRTHLAHESDPEIRHRLRYILENIVPPERAALVVRAAADTGLRPGDLITHLNSQRIRTAAELYRRVAQAPADSVLRARGVQGPYLVGPLPEPGQVTVCDYAAPRGEVIARVVRSYADGFAETAYEALAAVAADIPENELSALLRARIAHTAGDGSAALRLLQNRPAAAGPVPAGNQWRSPSELDQAGPGKAPLQLEWALLTLGGESVFATRGDPDIRVQRVLVPARRFDDALHASANLWWCDYRDRLGVGGDEQRQAGNMLAVVAWMFHELDLQSECTRLIGPRSGILGHTWIRVQTDAWLPFLAGDATAALEGFYADARQVLQQPLPATDPRVITRNPQVAALLAFFLYQFPDDPRVAETLELVNYPGHVGLAAYAHWMLFALREQNLEVVRRDLLALLPNLPDTDAIRFARAVALLEYMRNTPDDDVFATVRQRVTQVADTAKRETALTLIEALQDLAAGRAREARETLAPFAERPELTALRHTATFLCDPPLTAANHPALSGAQRPPLLAVPLGTAGRQWVILAHDRRLLHFDVEQGLLTALEKPTPSWFPNPLTWPWIGREQTTGRVWVYARRRVLELQRGGGTPLRLNIRTRDIPAFDRYLKPVFSTLAGAVAAMPRVPGENGEYLRSEIQAHGEYTADPDLPEIGLIRALPGDPRFVHVALRGGPHLLIDAVNRRAWSSLWMAGQLGLDAPPRFFAQPLPESEPMADLPTPVIMLMSDQGLIRFDVGAEALTRIALPGEEPFPPVIPESVPYERRDPRYVYCARLPAEGGQVYRLVVADNRIEALDMTNAVLPEGYFDVLPRAVLRTRIAQRFQDAGLPDPDALIDDASETVARWRER